MTIRPYFTLLGFILISNSLFSQSLSKPQCLVENYFFSDSTRIELINENEGGTIVMEIGQGNNTFFREYSAPFYVDQTKTISCKITHPDYDDSKLTAIKVYKLSNSNVSVSGEGIDPNMLDGKKGGTSLDISEWSYFNTSEIKFQLYCSNRKLEEVELLSYVNTSQNILPPRKVALHAHLKNGKVVHVRTANTVGTFKDTEQNWSHVVRLSGKPKLKKILKKTEYFTLTAFAQKKSDVPQTMVFDEILVR